MANTNPNTSEVLLCSVEEIDEFISDPAHASHEITELVREFTDNRVTSQLEVAIRVAVEVKGWITSGVTTDAGKTYLPHPIALARFVRREVAIATARIACDDEDRMTKCVKCCVVLSPAELTACRLDHDELCAKCST